MRSLAAEGRTVFVSSHLMSEMQLTADQLVVIGRGRLIADAPIATVIAGSSRTTVHVRVPDPRRPRGTAGAADRRGGAGRVTAQTADRHRRTGGAGRRPRPRARDTAARAAHQAGVARRGLHGTDRRQRRVRRGGGVMTDAILHFAQELMSSWWIYLALFGFAALDGFFPAIPSETLVVTAGVFAATGEPNLYAVIAVAAAGAFVGDHVSYALGRGAGGRLIDRTKPGTKRHAMSPWARNALAERGGLVLVVARYVPGGRTAVTLTMGAVRYPLRQLLLVRRSRRRQLGHLLLAGRLHRRQGVRGQPAQGRRPRHRSRPRGDGGRRGRPAPAPQPATPQPQLEARTRLVKAGER